MSTCRSCGAEIRWAVMEESGKRIPLDALAVDDGNLSEVDYLDNGTPVVAVTEHGIYKSHFATCPQAASWRRGPS